MRYTGPKNKVARRENMDLGMKTLGSKAHATLLRKLNIGPGQHGASRRRKISERGRQLREKQKLKFLFGISEKQLANYFSKASHQKGNTGEILVKILESRLDNVVFRLGFAPTRAAARQLVNHGHIKVNDRMLNVPSYLTNTEDTITFASEASTKIPAVEAMFDKKDLLMPAWLDVKGKAGKIIAEPVSEDIANQINLRLVVEYYSK